MEESFPHDLFIQSPFWNSKIETLCHPVAIRMAQDLDPEGILGIGDGSKTFWKGFKHNYGQKDSNIDFLIRIKKQHPQKIVLIQIGEFYETWGIDSVFLVEYCGINRMGRKAPRAGMPLANIQAVLDDLTEAGFSIVICEQSDDVHKNGKKVRFISEIITPSSPTYTYGLAMSHKSNVSFPEAAPEFAVAVNNKGIKVVEINPDLRTSLSLEGLTQEAAIIRLTRYGGRINRIFIHDNIDKDLLNLISLKFQNIVRISDYSSNNFAKRVEELIKIDLGLDANISFLEINPIYENNFPRPLYQTTAQQIGILPKRGIPDLIQLMLPKGSPSTCKYIIKNLLLNPLSAEFAQSLRQIILQLQLGDKDLPNLIVSNPVKYIKTLNKGEAHPEILKDLFSLSQIFLICQSDLTENFIKNTLEIVSYLSAIKADTDILFNSSKKIIDLLQPILPIEQDLPYIPENEAISSYLFEHIEEEFRARIARTSSKKIANLYDKIEQIAQQYEEVLTSDLLQAAQSWPNQKGKKKIALSYDIHNKAIWLSASLDTEFIRKNKLINPTDRYGKKVKDKWTTKKVEAALGKYKYLALEISQEVKKILKKVSEDLTPYCLPIIHLTTFSNLIKTVYLHVKECHAKNWTANFISSEDKENRIAIDGFFPYWLRVNESVSNSIKFDGTCLLTGHNMAGKSTLIRSVAVVTLLGSVGFMFPARKLALSESIDGWFVRTGAQDDPEAGLSAFAVEMTDIKVALRDASSKTLLLIDELGKGTESKAGHAIAASILEYLEQKNIKSIFATHWHEIFINNLIRLDNIKMIKIEPDSHKLLDGVDLNSSAFDLALKIGIDQEIVIRAKQIAKGYDNDHLKNIKLFSEINLAKEILATLVGKQISEVQELKSYQIPALKDAGSIVYVLRTQNNFFYVGETDNFLSRVKAHRHKFNKCEFIYINLENGKGQARKIEQELIIKLKNNGFPMLSTSDGKNISFS